MGKYNVGDKVRIVSKWGDHCYQNREGLMDKWLGKTMTIRGTWNKGAYKMEEDRGENKGDGWAWNENCIAGLAHKFKVGDRVIGRKECNEKYAITVEGWIGTVTDVEGDYIYVDGAGSAGGLGFRVHSDYFDLADNNQKIVITRCGAETIAKLYEGKKVVKTASAKCCSSDTFDFNIGAKIAVDRLLGVEKAEKEETPKYYNGKVVCVERGCKGSIPINALTVGKVYTVTDGRLIKDDGRKSGCTYENIEELCRGLGHKFIPFVE